MSKVGFVVLAHDNIFRLRQVINHLSNQDVPIALHLDAKTPAHKRQALQYFFQHTPRLYWAPSIRCEWGEWSIVEAQIRATKCLMENEPELDYIYNISGSCLPLRPVKELEEFLDARGEPYDYIESVAIDQKQWVVDGLEQERIQFYHPFNWQNQRKLFDANVKFQRMIKFRRKIPNDLTPSFGSQWWCLSTPTLRRIFEDPKFDEYAKFFEKSWIPDESFFQTLARKHSPRIENRSLTYATFDSSGKPFLFYDDHKDILARLDSFFIRKIWRGADKLYSHFLNPNREILNRDSFALPELEMLLSYSTETCEKGRPGLISQFIKPKARTNLVSRAPYFVYVGFQAVEEEIYERYYNHDLIAQMGYLFHPNRTEFELSKHKTPKNAPDLYLLRDYDKLQFLIQRVWFTFPRTVAFLAKPHHLKHLDRQLARDPNAQVIFIQGAWLLDRYKGNVENIERLRTICQIEIRREKNVLKIFETATNPNLHFYTLGEFLSDPNKIAAHFPDEISFQNLNIEKTRFQSFVRRLDANGISLKNYKLENYLNTELLSASQDEQIVSLSDYAKAKKR